MLADETQTDRQPMHERRCDERGLTTLEWLLIVAAVAGLAALAVVLVTNVVSDTADDISGQNARLTAARIAADEVTTKARTVSNPASDGAASKLNIGFRSDCHEIEILYVDIPNIELIWSEDISNASTSKPTAQSGTMDESTWKGSAKATRGCWAYTP